MTNLWTGIHTFPNISYWKWSFIVDFPIKNGDFQAEFFSNSRKNLVGGVLQKSTEASHLRSGSVYLYAFVAFGEFVALLIGLSLVE